MMKSIAALLTTSLLILSSISYGQAQSPKAYFESGARAYIKDGASAAIAEWIKGSALEGNTQATSQANSLRQIEDFYGKPESFEVLAESRLSERSGLVLGVINYQKGPLYARFQVFKLNSGNWVITEFKINTEAAQLFPNSLLYGRQ